MKVETEILDQIIKIEHKCTDRITCTFNIYLPLINGKIKCLFCEELIAIQERDQNDTKSK